MISAAAHQVILRIEGRVQGVWFRGWTIREATRLGLDGWVRNLADGSVEAVLAGPEQPVRDMIELCREGPPLAKVMAVKEATFEGAVEPGFRQRR
ncbi:MAG: acylphosphatase [Geminicoccales bacterium]